MKNILLVEDDPDLSSLMEKKLTDEGFTVTAPQTRQQTLDTLATGNPDFVLLDILLPDIDGLTILNEIASKPKTKNLPVIILSNLADQGSFEQAAAVGDYEYLVKAKTDLNDLVKKIKKRLNI